MSSTTWFRSLGASVILLAVVLITPGRSEPAASKKVALLVGVKQYTRSAHFPDLQYSENDVVQLAQILRSPAAGFKVRLLSTTLGKIKPADAPTAANIRKELTNLLKGLTPKDTVLVALSGHGVALDVADPAGKGMDNTYSFFCPSDADVVGVSWATGRSESLINFTDLFEELGKSGAGAKLVMVDACRNELRVNKRLARRNVNVESVNIPVGVGALFSCKAREYAHESERLKHGVFFHYVLEGLRGKAVNEDNEVTWLRLREYVTRKVRSKEATELVGESFTQTPHAIDNIPGESPVLTTITAKELVRRRDLTRPRDEKLDRGWDKEGENSIGMKLARVAAGKFLMGSPDREEERCADEKQHEVQITKEFWLGAHEVTQQQFKDVMGYNPSYFSSKGKGKSGVKYDLEPAGGKAKLPAGADTSDYPVENVTWEEAKEFCEKLTAQGQESKHGRKYRLPTEAEWEYACRGDAPADHVFHFGKALSSRLANFDGNYPYGGAGTDVYLGRTCKIGSYKPNRFGLFDMHGNVAEWCADWYDKDYYGKSLPKDPQGPSEGSDRVIRGGSCLGLGQYCRSAYRFQSAPISRSISVGFRVVLVASGK